MGPSLWVRVTHLPTGLRGECHTRRSAHARAVRVLRGVLWLHRHDPTTTPSRVRDFLVHQERRAFDYHTCLERESEAVDAMLDGDLDAFLRVRLGQGE
jgi:hypothetical protein